MLRVQLGATYGSDAHVQWLTEGIGVEVVAAFLTLLVGFHDQRVRFGVGVLTNAGDLPGNLHAGAAARDAKLVAGDLLCDVELRKAANRSQLVAEVVVECREPIRQGDGGGAVSAAHAVDDI